jgi:hypothetical protein
MVTKLLAILLSVELIAFAAQIRPTYTPTPKKEALKTELLLDEPIDARERVLREYLASKNSPLEENAKDLIEAADKYHMDWRLVTAISGVESSFGKAIPNGSYNGWGWGYSSNGIKHFNSWKSGIYELNQGLKQNYVNKGLTTPYLMNSVYAASPTWGARVSFFVEDLEKFAQKNPTYKAANSQPVRFEKNDAGTSAQLASL